MADGFGWTAQDEIARLTNALRMVASHAKCLGRRDRNPADCIDAAVGVAERALACEAFANPAAAAPPADEET